MFVTIFGALATIASIVGTVAFFTHSYSLLCWCALITVIDSLIQVTWGNQNNLNTEIATIVIFSIASFFFDVKWLIMVAFGLCITLVVMTLLAWIRMLLFMKK